MKKTYSKSKNNKAIKGISVFLALCLVAGAVYFIFPEAFSKIMPQGAHGNTEKRVPAGTFSFPVSGVRPVAVMIDNQGTKPLPQGGLYKAQYIYEALAEGGITRFMAIFYGNGPDKIGPVRSSRDYFVQYAMEHDAIYAHIGWSPQAKTFIEQNSVNNINGLYDGIYTKITSDPYNWQDKYTSYKKIIDFSEKKNYRLTTQESPLLDYNAKMAMPKQFKDDDKEKDAIQLELSYNSVHHVKYDYDSKQKVYKRFREGVPHMERDNGKQLTCGNIIIQFVKNAAIIGDNKNRQEMENIGQGTGWYITMGKAVPIKWSKASATSRTSYTYNDGTNLVLNPAQTWIQITPPTATVKLGHL